MRRTLRHTSKRSPLVFGLLAVLLVAALSVPAGSSSEDYGDPSRRVRTQFASFRHSPERLLAAGTRYATAYYDNDGRVRAGGHRRRRHARQRACRVHGGARGSRAYGPRKAGLIVIPEADKLAIEAKTRTGSHPGDLESRFSHEPLGQARAHRWRRVSGRWSSVSGPTTSLTSMKGTDFHKINKDSVGQSIIYYPVQGASEMARSHANRCEPRDLQLKAPLFRVALPSEREPGPCGGATSRSTCDDPGDLRKQPLETTRRPTRDHGESSSCTHWHAVIFSQRRKHNSLLTYPSKRLMLVSCP